MPKRIADELATLYRRDARPSRHTQHLIRACIATMIAADKKLKQSSRSEFK